MNSFSSAPQRCPWLSRAGILRLRPVACPDVNVMPRPGPGSGSLREFIEKIDSERSSKLPGELSQAKNDTYERIFIFSCNPRRCLLLLARIEHHVSRCDTASLAIFRVQGQVIFLKIVFMGIP